MKTKKKMSRALKSSLLLLLFIAGLASCKRNAIVPTGSYQYLYDFESRDIHPEYVIYHHSDDSSTVHFRVFSNELLFTRQATNSPFLLNLTIKATISDMNGMEQDTISVILHEAAKDRQGWLLGSMRVPMKTGQWNLLMEFTDVARNLTQPSFITCDKLSSFSRLSFKLNVILLTLSFLPKITLVVLLIKSYCKQKLKLDNDLSVTFLLITYMLYL